MPKKRGPFSPRIQLYIKVLTLSDFERPTKISRFSGQKQSQTFVTTPTFLPHLHEHAPKKCPTVSRSTLFHRNRTSAFVTTPVEANVHALASSIVALIVAGYPGSRFSHGQVSAVLSFKRVRPIASRTPSISMMGLE